MVEHTEVEHSGNVADDGTKRPMHDDSSQDSRQPSPTNSHWPAAGPRQQGSSPLSHSGDARLSATSCDQRCWCSSWLLTWPPFPASLSLGADAGCEYQTHRLSTLGLAPPERSRLGPPSHPRTPRFSIQQSRAEQSLLSTHTRCRGPHPSSSLSLPSLASALLLLLLLLVLPLPLAYPTPLQLTLY